jgi:mRNA interferase MazF
VRRRPTTPRPAGQVGGFPRRGEVWFGDLDPVLGREQGGDRPLLVISSDRFNALPSRLAVVVPLTRTARGLSFEVAIVPPEAGLRGAGVVLCDQPRAIAHQRLRRKTGSVEPQTLAKVDRLVKRVFGY